MVFLLWLFLVFFVGREYNQETGQKSFTITANGVTQFRKWLDISWGSRLVYQIDYSKYNELYTDPAQLVVVKQGVEDIILKNIDRRISALGVSDYRSFIQEMNDEHYVIVEIGWVSNLDEAKEIIGKTVELEFKLPNEAPASAESIAERRQLAQSLYGQVKASPEDFAQLTNNRGSDDVLYNKFTAVPLAQLPTIYQDNKQLLDTMSTGSLSPAVLEWVYLELNNDGVVTEGAPQSLDGFSFFRLLDRKTRENTIINEQTIMQTATTVWKDYESNIGSNNGIDVWTYDYNAGSRTLQYVVREIAPDGYAYDARIVAIAKESMLGKEQADIQAEETRVAGLVESVKNGIANGNIPDDASVSEVYNDWIEWSGLNQIIPTFTDTTEKVATYEWLDATYVVYNRTIKTPEEKLYSSVLVKNLSANEWANFEESMKTSVLYTLEDVFVQNKQSWITAIDESTNRVLNGAYFKMASVSSSQLGKPVVLVNFDDTGKEVFCNITEQAIGKQMAIFVWGELVTAPTIQDKICGGTAQIDGSFDAAWAKTLVDGLNEGALPAALIVKQEEKISATLWENALIGALVAALVGIVLIIVLIRYMYGARKAAVTIATLIIFLITLLALVKLIDYAMSLSAIAAIILSIGMGVDANVLIYERVREELIGGKSIKSAIETAYERSRSAIRDGNLSTWLIALLLFTLWVNIFKWFGSMMIINVLLILFVMTPLIKELLELAFHKKDVFLTEGSRWLSSKADTTATKQPKTKKKK